MDNDSVSNASSYKARGPLRNIIKPPKKQDLPEKIVGRSNDILIEADSSDEELALESDNGQSLQSMDVASQSQASVAASSNVQLSSASHSDQQIMFVLNKVLKGQKLYDQAQEEMKQQNFAQSEEKKREQLNYGKSGTLEIPKAQPKRKTSHNNIFIYQEANQIEESNTNIAIIDKEVQPKKMITKMASMGIDSDNNDDQVNDAKNMNFLQQWQKDIIIDNAMEDDAPPKQQIGGAQHTQTDEETQAAIVHISKIVQSDHNSNLDMCDQLSNLSAQQKEKLSEIPFQELIRLIQESYVHTGKYVKRPCE